MAPPYVVIRPAEVNQGLVEDRQFPAAEFPHIRPRGMRDSLLFTAAHANFANIQLSAAFVSIRPAQV